MKAAIHEHIGRPLSVEEVALREPGPGEVVIEMRAAAVCITDVIATDGITMVPTPFIPGHAGTGVVIAVGPGVERTPVGSRVSTAGSAQCGVCYPCVHDTPSSCEDIFGGMVPPREVATRQDGTPVNADGGVGVFAERMVIRESGLAIIDSTITDAQAALLGCGVISGVGAVVNIAQVRPGATVAVVGCGHLGLWIIQAAALVGAKRIIAVETDHERRALALELGATHAVNPTDGDPVAQVADLTGGRGADYSFEAGGTTRGSRQAVAMARGGGIVVTTSMAHPTGKIELDALDFGVSGKHIRSSQSGGGNLKRDIPAFANLVETGRLATDSIISRTFALGEVNDALDAARHRKVITGVIDF
ncbi:hypothetical protein CH267_06545 [Rhodococcus sp. 06-621-2]|nr:zinc-binding dehydrogenase [Rhodococcus sp. 06-621-2]OZC59752.1 hypothetical protein CH267_06545 [Rhodococcus sp. 06-621-2]